MPESRRKPSFGLFVAVVVLVAMLMLAIAIGAPDSDPAEVYMSMVYSLRYELFPLESEDDLADLHDEAGQGSRAQCVACHGDKTDSQLPVHRIHLTSDLLRDLRCSDCHPQVELGSRGATTAVTWVDVGFCKKCHSAFPCEGCDTLEHEQPGAEDCIECHTGELAVRHDQPYLSRDLDTSECLGCHGGRELPWTPRHEQEGWLVAHGMEALEVGEEHCFECHDFGLKFCDECHAETPPTHLPSDAWKDAHPDEAQRDTRVCYTCHETDFCKGCHVNHEDGWMETHPAFVDENGDTSCTECHSLSSCTFCHTATVIEERSAAATTVP